jgi:hypothetical protein
MLAVNIKSRLNSFRECLLPCSSEYFYFLSAENRKDLNVQNYSFICCSVWVCYSVSHIKGGGGGNKLSVSENRVLIISGPKRK